jgi:hypothetical protein
VVGGFFGGGGFVICSIWFLPFTWRMTSLDKIVSLIRFLTFPLISGDFLSALLFRHPS